MKAASIIHNVSLFFFPVFAGYAATIAVAQGAEQLRPAEYPSAWGVQFGQAAPLPPDYAFGNQTTVLKKGSVYPPAAKPLPCDVSW
jgi:hypothetical protein